MRRSPGVPRRRTAEKAGKRQAGPLDTGTLAALIALQGQGGVGHAGLFGKLDTDGDGVISKSEHAAFTLLGANGDGVRHAFAKASVGDLSLWER